MELAVLTESIEKLLGSEPSAYADAETIEILHRLQARFDAFVTRSTAAFDAAGNWEPDGARNAVAWLTTRCRLPKVQARRIIRRGRDLRHLPQFDRAWAGGEITAAQVDVVAQLQSPSTEEALARDEEMLVEQAGALRYDHFVRATDYWKQFADPDGVDGDDEAGGPGVTSTSTAASAGCGWARSPSTPSPERSSAAS